MTIFVSMQKAIKQISYIFIFFSLTLVWADYGFTVNSDNYQVITCNDCSDFSNHPENCHSHGFEDKILTEDSKVVAYSQKFYLIPSTDDNLKNNYFSSIWQPPKFS